MSRENENSQPKTQTPADAGENRKIFLSRAELLRTIRDLEGELLVDYNDYMRIVVDDQDLHNWAEESALLGVVINKREKIAYIITFHEGDGTLGIYTADVERIENDEGEEGGEEEVLDNEV